MRVELTTSTTQSLWDAESIQRRYQNLPLCHRSRVSQEAERDRKASAQFPLGALRYRNGKLVQTGAGYREINISECQHSHVLTHMSQVTRAYYMTPVHDMNCKTTTIAVTLYI